MKQSKRDNEPDAAEAQRLLSIAEYWVRLADSEGANHLWTTRDDRCSAERMKPGRISF
jgi:hypothetical protein